MYLNQLNKVLDKLTEENYTLSEEINDFDKAVYCAVTNLVEAGNDNVMLVNQVYTAFGQIIKSTQDDLNEIYKSLKKMSFIRINNELNPEHIGCFLICIVFLKIESDIFFNENPIYIFNLLEKPALLEKAEEMDLLETLEKIKKIGLNNG